MEHNLFPFDQSTRAPKINLLSCSPTENRPSRHWDLVLNMDGLEATMEHDILFLIDQSAHAPKINLLPCSPTDNRPTGYCDLVLSMDGLVVTMGHAILIGIDHSAHTLTINLLPCSLKCREHSTGYWKLAQRKMPVFKISKPISSLVFWS